MTDTDLNARLGVKLLDWFPPGHDKTVAREDQYAAAICYAGVPFKKRTDRWLIGTTLTPVNDAVGEYNLPDLSGSWEGMGLLLDALHERGWDVRIHYYAGLPEGELAAEVVINDAALEEIGRADHNLIKMAVALAAQSALKAE